MHAYIQIFIAKPSKIYNKTIGFRWDFLPLLWKDQGRGGYSPPSTHPPPPAPSPLLLTPVIDTILYYVTVLCNIVGMSKYYNIAGANTNLGSKFIVKMDIAYPPCRRQIKGLVSKCYYILFRRSLTCLKCWINRMHMEWHTQSQIMHGCMH